MFATKEVDDVHLFEDSLAAISHQRQVNHAGVSVDAFFLHLCCFLRQKYSWMWRLRLRRYGNSTLRMPIRQVRVYQTSLPHQGFDKLTSAGMNVIGTELVQIIEEVLPAKFGGHRLIISWWRKKTNKAILASASSLALCGNDRRSLRLWKLFLLRCAEERSRIRRQPIPGSEQERWGKTTESFAHRAREASAFAYWEIIETERDNQ